MTREQTIEKRMSLILMAEDSYSPARAREAAISELIAEGRIK